MGDNIESLARQHVVELEQCALFVDSLPLRKAMTEAAAFLLNCVVPQLTVVVSGPPQPWSLDRAFQLGYDWSGQVFGSGQNREDSRSIGRTLVGPLFDGLALDLDNWDSFQSADHGICEGKRRIRDALAALPLSVWQPMDLAPRSRDVRIDLVVHDRTSGKMWREPACCWAGDWGWQAESGRSVCGRRYYDDEGETCYDPLREDEASVVAVRWMPIPALPQLDEGR